MRLVRRSAIIVVGCSRPSFSLLLLARPPAVPAARGACPFQGNDQYNLGRPVFLIST
jgi:hypothetical protein